MAEQVVVDATNHIAGRLCSYVAKMLLKGDNVIVLNSEKAMLSGNRYAIIREWHEYLEIGSIVNPVHGPFHARRPDRIITRMVRGMVPKQKAKGVSAMKRLRVYIGVPKNYQATKAKEFDDAKIRKPAAYYTSVHELAKSIGWNE
ncbi:MAG: 50S ribosomal protein L13 [Nitrososphaerales archaeon]